MAQVRFHRLPPKAGQGRKHRLEATFERSSDRLPRVQHQSATDQLEPRPGVRGLFPAGTDNRTPGMTGPRSERGAFVTR